MDKQYMKKYFNGEINMQTILKDIKKGKLDKDKLHIEIVLQSYGI